MDVDLFVGGSDLDWLVGGWFILGGEWVVYIGW